MTATAPDPVTERGQQEDAVKNWYDQAHAEASHDYRQEVNAAWDRYKARLDGLDAERQSAVERIRNGTHDQA
jgi:hypothetical protein